MKKSVARHLRHRLAVGLLACITMLSFFGTDSLAASLPGSTVPGTYAPAASVPGTYTPSATVPESVILAGDAVPAVPNVSPVVLDGKVRAVQAYTIQGNNYFKLRELARVLARTPVQFDVQWNAQEKAVDIISGVPYVQPPAVGGATGTATTSAWPSASPLYLDGDPILVTAYTIDGSNYFKLRDIGRLFGFSVSWDPVDKQIVMDTGMPYEVSESTESSFSEASMVHRQHLVSGVNKSMLIDPDGTLWAAGDNTHGELGIGGTTDRHVFVKIREHVAAVSGNAHSTFILDRDGTLYGCGTNTDVRVWWHGHRSGVIDKPVRIMSDVRDVAVGAGHYVVLKNDGTVWTWGRNDYGELGDGRIASRLIPMQVMSDAVAVKTSGYSTFVLTADQSLWGFGWNASGQLGIGTMKSVTGPVKILRDVMDFDSWIDHAAAVTTDGTLLAWGGQVGPLPVPVLRHVVRVETGDNLTGALGADGSLWLWGRNAPDGNLQPMAYFEQAADFSLAGHAMVLHANGSVWAWGDNAHGQLGNNTVLRARQPVRVATGLLPGFSMAPGAPDPVTGNPENQAADAATTMPSPELVAVQDNLSSNEDGAEAGGETTVQMPEETVQKPEETVQMPEETVQKPEETVQKPEEAVQKPEETVSAPIAQEHPLQSVAINDLASYFLLEDGSLRGWGWNGGSHIGALGRDGSQYLHEPVLMASDMTAVEASGLVVIGLNKQGELWRWGANTFDIAPAVEGMSAGAQPAPTRLRGEVTAFSMGNAHMVAVDNDGILWGWGRNDFHQMGPLEDPMVSDIDIGSADTARAVKLMDNVLAASAGAYHTVVLKKDGSVWQLGVTTTNLQDNGAPTRIMDGAVSISAGTACSAAIREDGSLWTWGLNHEGWLGTGDTENRTRPVQILTNVRQVTMADGGTAVMEDDTLWSWGENALAQDGDGTVTRRLKPVRVMTDVSCAVRDARRVMVRKRDNTLWGWGAQLSEVRELQRVQAYAPVWMMLAAR